VVANNIKLIEEHVKQRLKQIVIVADDDADAWHEFEKKYASIHVAQQTTAKVKNINSEAKTELNISKQTIKGIIFAISFLVLAITAYFVWPYIANFKTAAPTTIDSTLIGKPTPPVINAPITPILSDTIKKDSNNVSSITVPSNTIPTSVVKPPITNTTIIPPVNKPKQDVVKPIDSKPKEEKKDEKKPEGEFDFFDKPIVNDSLRIY
jgi:hypothetical protein